MNNIKLIAEKTLANDSPDHLEPLGTRRDNTRNLAFNNKLYNLFPKDRIIEILDLGCSGGGFVKDCLDAGHFAVGLDGSDYSKNLNRAGWGTIPNNLFTCDITKDFKIKRDKDMVYFDVITLWDVIEHIKEDDLDTLFNNIRRNLCKKTPGLVIMAVGTCEEIVNGEKLHQTVKNKDWWLNKFDENGFIVAPGFKEYFRNQWVKGKYHYNRGFTVVLKKRGDVKILPPKLSLSTKIFDMWADSKIQLIIRRLAYGYMKNG